MTRNPTTMIATSAYRKKPWQTQIRDISQSGRPRPGWVLKKILVCSLVGACVSTRLAVAADAGFMIAEDGLPRCVIAVAEDASPAEQTAARELQAILQEVSGAELPIRLSSEVALDARQIVVGPSARLNELLPDLKLDAIGADGIVIRTVGNALVLAGPRPRGTLYAVYTFLEDQVGCRWWTPTESTIPRKPTLSVPPLAITYAPKLKMREAYYRDAFEETFSARQKLNGHHNRIGEAFGGTVRFSGFVHTFHGLLPPEKYFQEHPEWYSLRGGKRIRGYAQLCLTNDEMLAEMIRAVLGRLAKDPGAELISISQNDNQQACQCEKCKAVVAEEGSEAGPMLRFVNAVAEAVEKEFPNVWVETLAYLYTRKAPLNVRPRANVVVRLCSIECSFVHPLGEGPENEPFRRDIEAWSEIAPQLLVWDYVTNFRNYLIPHPNLRVLAPNVRFFVDHNVVGLFAQGDDSSGIGDFVRLRAWLLAQLMWDPSRDENALIDAFLSGYYGPAAPSLRAYLDLICDAGERYGKRIGCYMGDTSAWLTLDDLNRATELFARAEAAVAGNPMLAARVRRERLPLDHVWISRYRWLKRSAQREGRPFLGPDDPLAASEAFVRESRANGVGNWCEGSPFDGRAAMLLRRYGTPTSPPREADGMDPNDWLDLQDGEFRLAGLGRWVEWVDDAAASDGSAARMPGNHEAWAIQLPLSADVMSGNPWRVYASVRCDATAKTGVAMTMGFHGPVEKRLTKTITVEEAAGPDYRVFDLGVHALSDSMYFWVAPPNRPGDVQHVYVDRLFLIRHTPERP